MNNQMINKYTKEELKQLEADAKRYRWLVDNHKAWSWLPSMFNKDIVSGFAAKGTGYLGYTLEQSVDLAMKDKRQDKL